MKIQTSQFVIPAKAGTQICLWYKTIFYHLYEMLIFLNVSLGSCFRRNDNWGTFWNFMIRQTYGNSVLKLTYWKQTTHEPHEDEDNINHWIIGRNKDNFFSRRWMNCRHNSNIISWGSFLIFQKMSKFFYGHLASLGSARHWVLQIANFKFWHPSQAMRKS